MPGRTIARGMRPHRRPLDEDSADRLLQGVVHPDDAPPDYGSVAHLLGSAGRLSLEPVDEDKAAATVSAMVEVVRGAAPAPAPKAPRRRPLIGKLLAGKALAVAAVLGLTATGAAAATGSLPDPVQGVVSDAVGHVGVDIPHPNRGKSAGHRQDGEHRKNGQNDQEDQTGADGQPADDPQDGPGKGMSEFVEEHKGGEGPLGQVVCVEASDGKCRAGENHPGKSGDGEDDATSPDGAPSGNKGNGKGQGSGDDAGETPAPGGDDAGDAENEDDDGGGVGSTPSSAGGPDTGAAKSGKTLPVAKGTPGVN